MVTHSVRAASRSRLPGDSSPPTGSAYTAPGYGAAAGTPSRSVTAAAKVSHTVSLPWSTNTRRGFSGSAESHESSISRSAWPLMPSSVSICARTMISSPNRRTLCAPSTILRPTVPSD